MKQPSTYDAFPNYGAAGSKTQFAAEGAAQCVKPDLQTPGTPEHIKRYRKSHKHATGQTITHYGKVHDPLPTKEFTYGLQTAPSDHVPRVLNDAEMEGVHGYIRNMKEEKYARNKNEPLGKTVERNYNWPSQAQTDNFRFGVPTKGSESTKDVLYTAVGISEPKETKDLYIRSHGMYDAGEQKNRNYKWPFDPSDRVFGKSEKALTNEGRYCLQPETVDETFPKTQIIQKNVEDFRDYNREPLGKPKNLAQTNPYVGNETVFGYKPKDLEPWNAAKCIQGEAVYAQVREDDNLGRANRHGYKNTVKPGDENRVFGVPTVRNDIKKPSFRSVADTNNYGDEPVSVGLLFPERFSDMGISKEDFYSLRPKEEIRRIFANIGYSYKPGKFEGIFMRAQDISGAYDEVASVSSFLQAIKEMNHLG